MAGEAGQTAERRSGIAAGAVGAGGATGRVAAPGPAPKGLVDLYARRAIDRGADLRAMAAAARAACDGGEWRALATADRGRQHQHQRVVPFGRGTPEHKAAMRRTGRAGTAAPARRPNATSPRLSFPPRPTGALRRLRPSWRLVGAGIAVLFLLPVPALVAQAEAPAFQSRYVVQPGDSLDGVAAAFGVDPNANLAASAVQNPPALAADEIVVIPVPGQTPDEAAATAAALDGTSPFVVAAHLVQLGETLGGIAPL